jgi:thymidylate synthase (methanogen type)
MQTFLKKLRKFICNCFVFKIKFRVIKLVNKDNQLPVLHVEAGTLGEAWIKTLKAVWDHGKFMPQHYEEKPSKEASVIVNVTDPLSEPKIHQADAIALSCCKLDGGSYIKEILEGSIDNKVDEGNLSYTYHRRLFSWGKTTSNHDQKLKDMGLPFIKLAYQNKENKIDFIDDGINQIEYLIEKAKQESISRKLQVTTWLPTKDLKISGAPCLQRLWFRIVNEESLIIESAWRSRDLYKAFGSNIVGIVELGKEIAKRLDLELVQYVDFSNSLHIYASDFKEIENTFEVIKKRGMKI